MNTEKEENRGIWDYGAKDLADTIDAEILKDLIDATEHKEITENSP